MMSSASKRALLYLCSFHIIFLSIFLYLWSFSAALFAGSSSAVYKKCTTSNHVVQRHVELNVEQPLVLSVETLSLRCY